MPLEVIQQHLVPPLHVFTCMIVVDQRKHLCFLILLTNMFEGPDDDIGIFADPNPPLRLS